MKREICTAKIGYTLLLVLTALFIIAIIAQVISHIAETSDTWITLVCLLFLLLPSINIMRKLHTRLIKQEEAPKKDDTPTALPDNQ
jgi:Flp pilus assembly pilin Flp